MLASSRVSIQQDRNGWASGEKFLFPHDKVDDQPNKKPKKGYYSHKRRESDDKNAVAIAKSVPQLDCVSQDSEALVSQRGKSKPGENRCQKSWDRSKEFDSLSPRYVTRVSRTRMDHRMENTSQTSTSAKSLRSQIRKSVSRRD